MIPNKEDILKIIDDRAERLEAFLIKNSSKWSVSKLKKSLIDCDKEVHDDDINDTKRRIIDEFNKNNFYCWLTKGKEIENYISETNYRVALDKLLKAKRYELDFSQFNTITKVKINGKEKELDKIKLAKLITTKPPDWTRLDLETKVNELVTKIKKANNLS